jgi:hypothetical protein
LQPWALDGYSACVSLDRMGTTEVITHQLGMRCCSDAFAASFAAAVGMSEQLKPSKLGARTDSENYKYIIPECANIGVGYQEAHGKDETVDMNYAVFLRDRLCAIDLSKLVIERDPTKKEVYSYDYGGYGSYNSKDRTELDRGETIKWLLKSGTERYFFNDSRPGDDKWFDRVAFKWVSEKQKEVWPPRKNDATLLDHRKVLTFKPSWRKQKKKERRAKEAASSQTLPSVSDWRERYSPSGPAELKAAFENQLTRFVNRHARDFAEAVVQAGWTPEDILTMMFDKHGKMYDIDNIER